LELAPKQIWTVAAEAEAKNFYMVEPEIWVPVTQSWGASELTYCWKSVVCRTCTTHLKTVDPSPALHKQLRWKLSVCVG